MNHLRAKVEEDPSIASKFEHGHASPREESGRSEQGDHRAGRVPVTAFPHPENGELFVEYADRLRINRGGCDALHIGSATRFRFDRAITNNL